MDGESPPSSGNREGGLRKGKPNAAAGMGRTTGEDQNRWIQHSKRGWQLVDRNRKTMISAGPVANSQLLKLTGTRPHEMGRAYAGLAQARTKRPGSIASQVQAGSPPKSLVANSVKLHG